MSGHSKWSQIKRQKAVADNKRSNVFTKLANAISIAAKQGGGDPETNFKLRLAIEKAKSANMPNENIDRSIKRGGGELGGSQLEEVVYEGYGPGGVAVIIEAATDNKNRTASTIRSTLAKHGGNLGNAGSVAWLFDQKGVIRIAKNSVADKETFELKIIDAGADDIIEEEEGYTVMSAPAGLPAVKKAAEEMKATVESAGTEWLAKSRLPVDPAKKAALEKLFDELEENDDINNYFTNADL